MSSSVNTELPFATLIVVAHHGDQIVGVGAIKRVRPDYTSKIAQRSGVFLDPDTPDLGYVAVDSTHRGNNLSDFIVEKLLSKHRGPLFATTFNDLMKKTLTRAGFVQKGNEWAGQNGQLSLWMMMNC
jgi:hypothetical protein